MKYQSVIEIRVTLIQGELFLLNLPDMKLMPGDEQVFSWYIFSHKGGDDFRQKVIGKRVSGYLATSMYLRREKLPL